MKYTIVIDTSLSANQTEAQVREEIARHFKVEYVESGDQTNRDFFSVIRWHDEDITEALLKRDIPATEDNIELVKNSSDTLEDQSIELGWDVLDIIISDIEFDNNFNTGEDNE